MTYIISFTQPAFYIDSIDYKAWANSTSLLFIGWLGAIIGGGGALVWLANPLIFASWLFSYKSENLAIAIGVLAAGVALFFLSVNEIITSDTPTFAVISELKLGYWLWMIGISFFPIGMVLLKIKDKVES